VIGRIRLGQFQADFIRGTVSDRIYVYLYPAGTSKFRYVAMGDARTEWGAHRIARKLARAEEKS
jgi:hypothetical protein